MKPEELEALASSTSPRERFFAMLEIKNQSVTITPPTWPFGLDKESHIERRDELRPLVNKGLADKDYCVRIAALYAQSVLVPSDEFEKTLCRVFRADENTDVALAAAGFFKRPDGKATMSDARLQLALENEDMEIRSVALDAASKTNKMGLPRREVYKLLQEGGPLAMSAYRLCQGGCPHVTFVPGTAQEWAVDDNPDVRRAAMALAANPEEDSEILMVGMEDKDRFVQAAAITSWVQRAGLEGEGDFLMGYFDRGDYFVQTTILNLMDGLERRVYEAEKAYQKMLDAGLHADEFLVRAAAVQALTKIGGFVPVRDVETEHVTAKLDVLSEDVGWMFDHGCVGPVYAELELPKTASIIKAPWGGYYATSAKVVKVLGDFKEEHKELLAPVGSTLEGVECREKADN